MSEEARQADGGVSQWHGTVFTNAKAGMVCFWPPTSV